MKPKAHKSEPYEPKAYKELRHIPSFSENPEKILAVRVDLKHAEQLAKDMRWAFDKYFMEECSPEGLKSLERLLRLAEVIEEGLTK